MKNLKSFLQKHPELALQITCKPDNMDEDECFIIQFVNKTDSFVGGAYVNGKDINADDFNVSIEALLSVINVDEPSAGQEFDLSIII